MADRATGAAAAAAASAPTGGGGASEGQRMLRCELHTPFGTVFSGNVRVVIAPGVMGEMAILPLHAPLMTALRIGELRVKPDDDTEILYAVGGGFMEVREDRVIILATTCEAGSEIDVERAEAAKAQAEKTLAEAEGEEDVERAQADLERALNRLSIARR